MRRTRVNDALNSQAPMEQILVKGWVRTRRDAKGVSFLEINDGSGLNYAGAAFIALAGEERDQFFAELDRVTASWGAFKSSRLNDVKWCHPKLTVRVKHLAGSKTLRHATLRELLQARPKGIGT